MTTPPTNGNGQPLITCILCGRVGVQGFTAVAADPEHPEAGHQFRCRNRTRCKAVQERTQQQEQPAESATPARRVSEQVNAGGESAAVAGLARQLDQLHHQVTKLDKQSATTAAAVAEIAEQVEKLTPSGTRTVAPTWLDQPAGVDAVSELDGVLGGLAEWMTVVYLRYPDAAAGLPECWLWHPHVVEELLWLQHAWMAAYTGKSASATAAGDWHDRYRPGVVKRITAAHSRCSLDHHTAAGARHGHRTSRTGTPGGAITPPALAAAPAIAAWWADRRADPPPEPPTDQLRADRPIRPEFEEANR